MATFIFFVFTMAACFLAGGVLGIRWGYDQASGHIKKLIELQKRRER